MSTTRRTENINACLSGHHNRLFTKRYTHPTNPLSIQHKTPYTKHHVLYFQETRPLRAVGQDMGVVVVYRQCSPNFESALAAAVAVAAAATVAAE